MPASLIVPMFFTAGTLGYAAATLAVHFLTTVAVGYLLNKNQPKEDQIGGKIQLPPSTDNKLPVVYGDSWVSPIITDVKISTDQQTMWYVLTFCETTDSGDITFGDIYWDDKVLIFDPNNPSEIRGWYNEADNTTISGVAGKISMWFYKNGSFQPTTHHCLGADGVGSEQLTQQNAISVMQDAGIPVDQRWTAQHTMKNTVFAIVRIKYDQDHAVTGIGTITAQVKNSLKQPGSVLLDYMKNSRYGAGILQTNINLDSLTTLNTYSAEILSLTNTTGGQDTGTRYEINGTLDTSRDCLTNLVQIADSADCWIQWNEANAKWGVLINRSLSENGGSTSTMFCVTADNIIGGIQITPLDLNSTYNSINLQFPNKNIKGQTDTRMYELTTAERLINEPNNQLNIAFPLIDNSLQATYIGYKKLWASRNDLIINFTMDYSGIQIDAGDIIAVNHEWYGWGTKTYGNQVYPGKPFRVTQVREIKAPDGFLSVQITATSYNDSIYTTTNPHYYTQQTFSGLTDPTYITKPNAPTIPAAYLSTATASFVVQGEIPEQGNVKGMEFWYSTNGPELGANNYSLYTTQNYLNASLYPHYSSTGTVYFEQIRLNNMPIGQYYWRTRAQGPDSMSEFSDPSPMLDWQVAGQAVSGTQILDHSISGSKVIEGGTSKGSQSNGFFETLGPIALAGLSAATLYAGYKKGWFGDTKPKEDPLEGGGNDEGYDAMNPNLWTDNQTPQIGDTVTYYADATPDPGDIAQYANFDDYDTYPGDSGFEQA